MNKIVISLAESKWLDSGAESTGSIQQYLSHVVCQDDLDPARLMSVLLDSFQGHMYP